jgi:hypothetical protein
MLGVQHVNVVVSTYSHQMLTQFVTRQIKRMHGNQKDCAKKVEKLQEKHAWIAREKSQFGKPGTDYDFNAQDARAVRQQLETKLAEQKR